MKSDCLVVVHSHWRVGGVRSVIERTLPLIVAQCNLRRVVLVSGEPAYGPWMESLRISCGTALVQEKVLPALGYVSEMRHPPDAALLQRFWRQVLGNLRPAAIWWHNPGLGRNVPAVECLLRENENRHIPLLFHHHDLWCDHRWNRWPEMQDCGYKSVNDVARVLFSSRADVTHLTINSRDYRLFHSCLGSSARKLGNPFDPPEMVSENEKQEAQTWLQEVCEVEAGTSLWLAPARLLRRKNLLESLLLMHRVQPGAVFVTSNQAPSRDELPYKGVLERVAACASSRLRLIDLNPQGAPRMAALHAAADVLIQSSLQEGFGLLFLEAAWAGKPIICRRLANVWPDLMERGLHFPLAYDETWVDLSDSDREIEVQTQCKIFSDWKKNLPDSWQVLVRENPLASLFASGPIPFSKLTLPSQVRAVQKEIESPDSRCAPDQETMPAAKLVPFTCKMYALEFQNIVEDAPRSETGHEGNSAGLQDRIVEDALSPANIFPILLGTQLCTPY
jgi:glycosyltransferase involved in cell wall biosynthesis